MNPPPNGTLVLWCKHFLEGKREAYFLKNNVPIGFIRPDFSIGETDWVMCCEECYTASKGSAYEVELAGDGPYMAA